MKSENRAINFLKQLKDKKFLYWIVLFIIGAVFFIQAFILAHQLPSRVDEGSFLIKGYLFISGKYTPFEDYGPWTNNMPMAYLIPGIPQVFFGPGLKVGRYFMIAVAAVTLINLWILVWRFRGKLWALAAVLALSINPSWIGISVQAVSQGIAACLVTWMMVLLIGEERKDWQIYSAAVLSAVATLTRQNMVFLMPFAILYIWWQFGFKKAVIAFIFVFLPFAGVHIHYYPKIMNLWYTWLPATVKSFFQVGSIKGGGSQVWRPDGDMVTRLSAFFTAIRYHFISLVGTLCAIPLILKKKNWRSINEWKAVLSSMLLFIILFLLHAWASLTKNYCIFCFPNYLAFFIPIATFIAIITISTNIEKRYPISTIYMITLFIVLIPGAVYSSLSTVGRWLMKLPVPRFKDGKFAGGITQLWELLRNRFDVGYDQMLLIVPPVLGLMIITGLLILFFVIYRMRKLKEKYHSGYLLFIGLVIFSFVFTPTHLLGNFQFENTCRGDVIGAYERAGAQLRAAIPTGKSVFWGSGSVVTPMLYIVETGIQPLQLNGIYPKRVGGDRDLLERDGYFNAESQQDWRNSAEFILVQYKNMGDFWKEYLDPALFDEYEPTDPIDPCDPNSSIKIFHRK